MAAQPLSIDATAIDPLAALKRNGAVGHNRLMRRLLILAGLAVAAGAVALAAPRLVNVFADAFVRALHADPRWVVAGIALELASFAGYIALFWHVARRNSPRVGLRASYEISLAGTAATRLLPTAGAGGAALTFWSLRRAGQDTSTATRTLLTFLVLLYSVFLGSILVAGTLLATHAVPNSVPTELSAAPAAAAGAAIAFALYLALRARRGAASPEAPAAAGRVRSAARALGASVHEATVVVRKPDARLLGAIGWWGFDLLVLWSTFNAFGVPPAPVVLVLGYFIGQVANTLPIPGAASGGMVAAFLALGMPAETVLPAVLAYRAIAIWTPVPAGAAALAGLRRTVARWAVEDGAVVAPEAVAEAEPALAPVLVLPTPRTRRRGYAAGLARRSSEYAHASASATAA
jgi:uncharacterized membrane protein YbhN (UPF0104 family)